MCHCGFMSAACNLQVVHVTVTHSYSVPSKSRMVSARDNHRRCRQRGALALLAGVLIVTSPALLAENDPDDDIAAISPDLSDQRILGVIPNFQTVSDPSAPFVPLTVKDKW